jgi:hypothetical protein
MPFEIVIDMGTVIKTVDEMAGKIKELQPAVQQEFVTWQTEDMNRKRPTVSVMGGGSYFIVETIIYPRGRQILVTAKQRAQARRRLTFRAAGRRPILRPELFQQLCARMRAMLSSMSWH